MKHLQKILVGIIVSSFFVMGVFASESNTQIHLEQATGNQLDLTWDKVKDAYGYYVSYGTKTGIDNGYEFELQNIVEGTKVSLGSLEGNTTYYVALAAIDENGDELSQSGEFSFTTNKVQKLPLKGVEVVGMQTLELSFGSTIDDSKDKKFIVRSLASGIKIPISDVVVNNSKVLITVESEFITSERYSVVIISLFGTDGSTIISGVDGAVDLTAPDMSLFSIKEPVVEEENIAPLNPDPLSVEVEQNDENLSNDNEVSEELINPEIEAEQVVQEIDDSEKIDLNSADILEQESDSMSSNSQANLAGEDILPTENNDTPAAVASKTSKLPTTGPEHIFIIFLSIVLGVLIFHVRKRKA